MEWGGRQSEGKVMLGNLYFPMGRLGWLAGKQREGVACGWEFTAWGFFRINYTEMSNYPVKGTLTAPKSKNLDDFD